MEILNTSSIYAEMVVLRLAILALQSPVTKPEDNVPQQPKTRTSGFNGFSWEDFNTNGTAGLVYCRHATGLWDPRHRTHNTALYTSIYG